jgi:RimJ/RimL family protein N-acetyltransferase
MRTRRLTLRSLTERDAPAIAAMAGDWDVARMTSRLPFPYGLPEAEAWLATLDDESAFGIIYRWRLVGVCGYRAEGADSAEIGYWIGKRWWGRGIATEAVPALLRHCFDIGISQVVCSHFADNPASGRVIAKLGFTPTGQTQTWCEARRQTVPAMTYMLSAAAAAEPRRSRS